MSDAEIITATEASRAFSELLHRVCYGGESFVIKKGSRLMARITPVVQEAEKTEMAKCDEPEMDEPLPDNVTEEEAEYFKTVIAQLRARQTEDA